MMHSSGSLQRTPHLQWRDRTGITPASLFTAALFLKPAAPIPNYKILIEVLLYYYSTIFNVFLQVVEIFR